MTEKINLYRYEEELIDAGVTCIAGCDEAGRGPLAGPLVVASVILPEHPRIEGLNDSKKLSEKKRAELYKEIVKQAVAYKIVFVSPKEIDKLNIYAATQMGMMKAVKGLTVSPNYVLIDFMPLDLLKIPHLSLVKGDALSATIAAASILAKVSRDEYMDKMDIKYPHYGFKHNKGYPTKMHLEALKRLGPCPIHRKSFGPVKVCFQEQEQLTLGL